MSKSRQSGAFNPMTVIFLVIVLVIAWAIYAFVSDDEEQELAAESGVDERIAPVGQVTIGGDSDAATPATADAAAAPNGKQIYDTTCALCHDSGVAGAPKIGDKEAWAPRIEQGNDVLVDHAIAGFTGKAGVMPAKGGKADLTDAQVRETVLYMVSESGGEPLAAPAADTGATETATPEKPAEVAETAEQTPAVASAGKGKEVYDSACFICHTSGAAGAPKIGDKEAWAPRIGQGMDVLYDHAINGFMGAGMMPPKGGRADLSDDDVKVTVDYIVDQSQ